MKTSVEQMERLAVCEKKELFFPEGLIGFAQHKYFSISCEKSKEPFLWIQSLSDTELSFIAIDPREFRRDYFPVLSENDKKLLQVKESSECQFLAIVYVPRDSENISANLLAPVAINMKTNIAKQVVLQDQDYQVQHFILEEMLKKAG
ncbi:MAG: flagellar assembly protein FliW [Candidatus Omnitrophica bacterium]|nr:flagellar assembly protein FliW [Candidatus Omnitrophota bacterium]